MPGPEPTFTPALWVSSQQVGEYDALVRFFTPREGAVTARARSLLKPGSKLAPALKAADELSIALAGVRSVKTLAGLRTVRDHAYWRASLDRLALVWFMTESAYVGSGPPQLNAQVFQLSANLLRSNPDGAALMGAAAVFAVRLLTLHGLMPDLDHCTIDHSALPAAEPAFLLPSGEGLVGRAAYNRDYASGRAALLRLQAERLARWRRLQRGPLLEYPQADADRADAAVLCHLLARQLGGLANQAIDSLKFLRKQWKLPGLAELIREAVDG